MCIPCSSLYDRCKIRSSDFSCQILIKSYKNSSSIFRKKLSSNLSHFYMSGIQFILFIGIFCFSIGLYGRIPTEVFLWCYYMSLDVSIYV